MSVTRAGSRLFLALLLVGGCNKRAPATSIGGGHSTSSDRASSRSVDAEKLIAAYASNPTRADARFDDREWKIADVIVGRIRGNAAWMEAQGYELRVSFEAEREVMRISNGDAVTVRCEGAGMKGEREIRFVNCRVISRHKPRPRLMTMLSRLAGVAGLALLKEQVAPLKRRAQRRHRPWTPEDSAIKLIWALF